MDAGSAILVVAAVLGSVTLVQAVRRHLRNEPFGAATAVSATLCIALAIFAFTDRPDWLADVLNGILG